MGIRLSPNNPKNNSWRDDYPMTYLTSFSDDRTKARKEQMTDISSMTNEQLNEALAIEVMGWTLDLVEEKEWGLRFLRDGDGNSIMDIRLWQPTDPEHLHQTVQCAEKTGRSWGIDYEVFDDNHGAYVGAKTNIIIADNPARALCEAVLMAVRGEG